MKQLTLGLGLNMDRTFSPKLAGALAQKLEASEVVDQLIAWDQLSYCWPAHMWGEEYSGLSKDVPDNSSYADAFLLAAIAGASTSRLGVGVTADAIRRGPAELMQTMLTLAKTTEGRGAALLLGAGEIKNIQPFGWKRTEGLSKLEDCFRIFREFLAHDEPFDFTGNHWTFDQAWLGNSRPYRPDMLALGGGPKLIEIAARDADGLVTAVPLAFSSPEQWAAEVASIKTALERNGRDPDDFYFGINAVTMVHEDPDVLDQALDNPLIRFITGIGGRLKQTDWKKEGQAAVLADDWHYALRMLPNKITPEMSAEIVAGPTREMVEKTYLIGSPKEVASTLQDYIDAGTNYIFFFDQLQWIRPLEEGEASWDALIDVCRRLKQPEPNAAIRREPTKETA